MADYYFYRIAAATIFLKNPSISNSDEYFTSLKEYLLELDSCGGETLFGRMFGKLKTIISSNKAIKNIWRFVTLNKGNLMNLEQQNN